MRPWDELGEPVEWLGLVRARELAGGPIDDALVEEIVALMQRALRGAQVDGMLISLHGALASPTIPDVDGYFLAKVREAIGPATALMATLDLHANLTARLRPDCRRLPVLRGAGLRVGELQGNAVCARGAADVSAR